MTMYHFSLVLVGRQPMEVGMRDLPDLHQAQNAAANEAYDVVCEMVRFSYYREADGLEVRITDAAGRPQGMVRYHRDTFTLH